MTDNLLEIPKDYDWSTWTPEGAAERGARLLDVKVPDWYNKLSGAIHDGLFDMGRWDHCVAGTLELYQRYEGSHGYGIIKFNGEQVAAYGEESEYFGFVTWEPFELREEQLEQLEAAWTQEVAQRRNRDGV